MTEVEKQEIINTCYDMIKQAIFDLDEEHITRITVSERYVLKQSKDMVLELEAHIIERVLEELLTHRFREKAEYIDLMKRVTKLEKETV